MAGWIGPDRHQARTLVARSDLALIAGKDSLEVAVRLFSRHSCRPFIIWAQDVKLARRNVDFDPVAFLEPRQWTADSGLRRNMADG